MTADMFEVVPSADGDDQRLFRNSTFGFSVRVVTVDGEPWFIGSDVCGALNTDPTNTYRILDEDEKGLWISHTLGGSQKVVIVSEAGLYSCMLRSRSRAAKQFKRWVTHEVLPAIRKTGSYNLPDFSNPAEAARAWAEQYEVALQARKQLEANQHKVDFFDTVADCKGTISMGEAARALNMGIGRNSLFALLRHRGILMHGDNLPYQTYIDRGYFRCVERTFKIRDEVCVRLTPRVTQKGLEFMRKVLVTNGYQGATAS